MPEDDGETLECADDVTEPLPPLVYDNCGNLLTPSGPVVGGTYVICEGTITYTWTYSDCEGNSHNWVYTYYIHDVTAPTLTTNLTSLTFECDDPVVIPEVIFEDNCTENVETICAITGFSGDCEDYIFMQGSETEICFWAVDDCGNESIHHCITITVNCDYCTMTQGYYGNPGGLYCDGSTTIDLITDLLSDGDLILGVQANNKTYTIHTTDAQCVIDILPGGGPSSALNGNYECGDLVGSKGRLNNSLLAQTITLGLNMRLDEELASLEFQTGTFFTRESSDCDNPEAEPIPGSEEYYVMPSCIMDLYGGQPTVQDIYNLANDALGGYAVNCGLSSITEALGIINDALDECRFIYFTGTPVAAPSSGDDNSIVSEGNNQDVIMSISPNPFQDKVKINYLVKEDSKVTLEVYNLQGVKIATIFDGYAKAGFEYTHMFTPAQNRSEQVMLVVLRTVYGVTTKQIISTH